MPRTSTVGSIHVRDLLESLRSLGADGAALRSKAGLTEKALRDPEARIPSHRLLAVFEHAERRLHDPLVGLHAGERVRTRGPLFYLLLSSRRLDEGLSSLARFARIALDTQRIRMAISAGTVSLTIEPGDPEIEKNHHAVDYILGAILGSIRHALPGIRPLGVDLTHGPIGKPGEAERAFGCPVRFGCRRNVLRFPASVLLGEPVAANAAVAEQLRKYAAALLSRVTSDSIEDRAADAIRTLLVDGIRAGQFIVARHLNMSKRTLKRRLRLEGTSFKAVRDRVRSETAEALLSNRSLKIGAVAQSVGFAETASFTRAFSRWSGSSPARYRERLRVRQRPLAAALASDLT
ncbi:MAG TPA: AraC family transcriptional regulator [Candidatus Polarisedimenticolia bacterium]|jgi:AraC-like DNA-binding protein|nr:AraC family transcriptional regulator [Candidatus Polarisedimenticolia bacterium]